MLTLYVRQDMSMYLPSVFRLSISFIRVSFTLDSALLTIPTQSLEGTPISVHSLVGGGDVREGNFYRRPTQRRRLFSSEFIPPSNFSTNHCCFSLALDWIWTVLAVYATEQG